MESGGHQHNEDKLSELPDCVLVHILSFLSIETAVRTGSISRRWKDLWKRLQTLSFNDRPFRTYEDFTEFVNQVLSLHDASTALVALDFHTMIPMKSRLLETIETFGALRNQNLKRLSIDYCHVERIPNFLFSCHSLESLTLAFGGVVFPDSLNLPALTYLNLQKLVFRSGDDGCAKPFSGFNKLKSLIIIDCTCKKYPVTISNATLVDLVIDSNLWQIDLSSPSLCTFTFNAYSFEKLYGCSLSCVKHVSITGGVAPFFDGVMPSWLIKLVNLESLTISSNTLWAFSHIPESDLLESKHTSLSNLKSLQVILFQRYRCEELILMRQRDVNVVGGEPWKGNAKLREAIKALKQYAFIAGVIDFLIQNSPSANVDILPRKLLPNILPREPGVQHFGEDMEIKSS